MRKLLFLFAASLFVARGILACGGDDAANSDGTKDATTAQDALSDNSTSDVVSVDSSTNDAADVNTSDSSDAGVATDSSDGGASDSSDASSDVVTDAPLSCLDGGIACAISMPCCMKSSSVEYGKCVILNLCK